MRRVFVMDVVVGMLLLLVFMTMFVVVVVDRYGYWLCTREVQARCIEHYYSERSFSAGLAVPSLTPFFILIPMYVGPYLHRTKKSP